ncbi:MAG: ATP-binding protein [Acidobacteria bacterium]|nr:ATP-binding protein [Acidobacteriota bacterium]MCI0623962.1 ATP-binding protein [Acidobacteriota bacterium]MCI0724656.1 ATP-binding protein [Acidobacteriota bacterium]
MERYLTPQVNKDLKRKMVFVSGARQVGKTTLAKQVLGNEQAEGYLNWDIAEHRERILRRQLPAVPLWAFDEIHKYRSWRNYLKGLYDAKERKQQILVTGSARLDFYRFGGDSLQGRYHLLRLHPLSVAELQISTAEQMQELLQLGGFPEPFLLGSELEARRWSREFRSRLIQEDVNSLERVLDLGRLELLMLGLPDRVGSPLSINSLREDLQVSHKTVAHWLDILERLYAIFRISPFGSPKLRAVKKEQKHYHTDWALIQEPSLRFENFVACHLLKWIHFKQDAEGRDLELRYFRDVDKREVDFVVLEGRKPLQLIECKWDDAAISPGLTYLKARFKNSEAYQISAGGVKDFQSPEGIRVCNALHLLKALV